MVSTVPIGKYRKLSFSALRGRFKKNLQYNLPPIRLVFSGGYSKYQNAPNFVKFFGVLQMRIGTMVSFKNKEK